MHSGPHGIPDEPDIRPVYKRAGDAEFFTKLLVHSGQMVPRDTGEEVMLEMVVQIT